MTESKPTTEPKLSSDLNKVDAYVLGPVDYDEVPELDDDWFDQAVLHFNRMPLEPRPDGMTKTEVCMNLDSDVVAFFKAAGADWQTRINWTLRAAMAREPAA